MRRPLAALLLTLAVVVADRLSKAWVIDNVSPWDTLTVIPGFFHIVYVENEGMAFSLLADADPQWRTAVLIGVSLVVLGFILVLYYQALFARPPAREAHSPWPFALLSGGAVGNLYDRLFRGSVTDFLDLHIGSYHWPTFNVADSAITVGACLLAIELLRTRRVRREAQV
jgi:signal peptidase II